MDIPASAMTLRDYFAAKAMALVCEGETTWPEVAEIAYTLADAMLEARTRRPTSWPDLPGKTDFANLP